PAGRARTEPARGAGPPPEPSRGARARRPGAGRPTAPARPSLARPQRDDVRVVATFGLLEALEGQARVEKAVQEPAEREVPRTGARADSVAPDPGRLAAVRHVAVAGVQ